MSVLGVRTALNTVRDLVGSVWGALHVKTFPSAQRFISRQRLTVATASLALTVPPGAYTAYLQIFTADIYYTRDETLPSATNGHAAYIGDDLWLYGADALSRFRMVRQGATSAAVEVSYYYEHEGDSA